MAHSSTLSSEPALDRTPLPEWSSSPFVPDIPSRQSSPLKRKFESHILETELLLQQTPRSSSPSSFPISVFPSIEVADRGHQYPPHGPSALSAGAGSPHCKPLNPVPRAPWSEGDVPLVIGRSSRVSNYVIPTSRLISRQHVRVSFHPHAPTQPSSCGNIQGLVGGFRPGQFHIECLGWNGVTVHLGLKVKNLKRGRSLIADRLGEDILLDIHGTKLIIPWPIQALPRQPSAHPQIQVKDEVERERSLTPLSGDDFGWLDRRRIQETRSSLPSSPPPMHSFPPSFADKPFKSGSDSFSGSGLAWTSIYNPDSDPACQTIQEVHEHRDSHRRAFTDELLSSGPLFSNGDSDFPAKYSSREPSSEVDILTEPVDMPSRPFSPSPSLSSLDELSDVEDDLPGDLFNSILSSMPDGDETVLANPGHNSHSLDCGSPARKAHAEAACASAVNSTGQEVLNEGAEDEGDADSVDRPLTPLPPSSPTSSQHADNRSAQWPEIEESPIRNHAINQLAFGRMKSMPLTAIYSQIPRNLRTYSTLDGSTTNSESLPSNSDVISPGAAPAEPTTSLLLEHFRFIVKQTPCIGEICRHGRDAAGKPLENEYYYMPEQDEDEGRKAAVLSTGRSRTLRDVRKTHKQYFWKKPRV